MCSNQSDYSTFWYNYHILTLTNHHQEPSSQLLHVGWVLRTALLADAPHLMRDRKVTATGAAVGSQLSSCRKCLVGTEMVDWLVALSATTPLHVHSRAQAVAMWQVLVEETVLRPVGTDCDLAFADKYLFYRFWFDDEGKECFPATQVIIRS